jgi:hypothetical protein
VADASSSASRDTGGRFRAATTDDGGGSGAAADAGAPPAPPGTDSALVARIVAAFSKAYPPAPPVAAPSFDETTIVALSVEDGLKLTDRIDQARACSAAARDVKRLFLLTHDAVFGADYAGLPSNVYYT